MKKLLFMFATAALVLSACSSEDDLVQGAGSPAQLGAAADAVGFDVYTQQATNVTKAGLEGTMTTNRMQRSEANGGGFGVYAYLTEDAVADAGDGANATAYAGGVPNFMVNEKILWNPTSLGWYYSPLKYWPNETDNDSQTTPAAMTGDGTNTELDRLTFFAYAPYVAAGADATGITAITDKAGKLSGNSVTDPTIAWVASGTPDTDFDPNKGVDLLWGVAPSGGLSYTAVNGWTVTRNEGTPLLNMIKPNVNTSMKFLFQHALARFGVTVVAAVDQVAPGGKLDPNTKITVNSVKISGLFGTQGELNLNNGVNANIANWTKIQDDDVDGVTTTISSTQSIVVAANATNNAIAENLRWTGPHNAPEPQPVVGVTTAKQDLLAPSTKWFNKLAAAPVYNPGKKYYTDEGTTEANAKLATGSKAKIDGKWGFFYTKDGSGVYAKQSADDVTPAYPTLPSTKFYFVKATAHTVTVADTKPTTIDDGVKVYNIDDPANDGSAEAKAPTFTNQADYSAGTWTGAAVDDVVYTLEAVQVPYTDLPYAYDPAGTYYEAERNYLYVVPTNNVAKNPSAAVDALRTIKVQIEYYITTEDNKLGAGRAQTKNVVTKEVVLPSLANGKSYNLNLVLGLTSVKIEAEVDDWKVVNSQVDLPQNTGE